MLFQPFWGYFYLYFTYHSHFTQKNIVPRSLRLRKTSHRLDLTQTVFPCVPRPHSSNSTSTHCVLPRSITFFRLYFVLTRVLSVSLRSHSIFVTYIGLHIRTYPTTYIHLSDHYWAGYYPFISPSTHWPHRNRLYQNFALLDHSVYSIIGCFCGCVLTT